MVGINFASVSEAEHMKEKILKVIDLISEKNFIQVTQSAAMKPLIVEPTKNEFKINFNKTNKKKHRKHKETIIISEPFSYVHISHIGFSKEKGFDSFGTNKILEQFFEKAGVSVNELRTKKTRKAIDSFMKDHGGVEAVLNKQLQYERISKECVSNN